MRLLATLLFALGVSPAFAGVLPLTGNYCGEDQALNADTFHASEDTDCRLARIVETGPTWWIVSVSCPSGASKLRVAVSPDQQNVAISNPDIIGEPTRLDRCPD